MTALPASLPAKGTPVTTRDAHHGRRNGVVTGVWTGGFVFGPIVWVRYPDGTDHHTLDQIRPRIVARTRSRA